MNEYIGLLLFHIFFVGPFLIYVGVQRAGSPELLFQGLIGLSIGIALYHSYKWYINWRAGSSFLWVNVFHVLVIAPLLLYIGVKQKDTPQVAFDTTVMLGFAAFGYNLYKLVLMTNTVSGGVK